MARSQPPQKAKPSGPKPTPTPKAKGGKPAKAASAPAGGAAGPSGAKAEAATVDSLRQEILDLGGDDADYAMLQNVDGDDDDDVLGGADDEVVDAKLSKELASFMKGLDFSVAGPLADESDHSSDDDSDGDEAVEVDDDESDEGEMPIDTPKKPAKPAPEPPKVIDAPLAAKKEEVKKAVASLATSANAVGPSPQAGTGSLVKGKNGVLIFPPLPQWYHHELPALAPTTLPALTPALLLSLTNRSSTLLTTLPTAPSMHLSSKSDANFLAQILKSGTQADKLSALILLVQGDPLRNISALEGLRAMMGWKEGGQVGRMGGREERVGVVRAVADWWNGGGAPNRKLRYLRDQPLLTHPGATDAHLLIWAFEDWLKKYFYTLLQILETLSHDTLPFVRTQTLTIVYQMLKDKPEQEQNLLRLLVNKLGDTDKTVASRASYHILQLLQSHPAMKSVVVREISSLVLVPPPPKAVAPSKQQKKQQKKKKGKVQPMAKKTTVFDKASDDNGNVHARYYGIITLNQTTLTQRDGDVAGKLVEVYFEVFKGILGDGKYAKEEEDKPVEVVEPEPAEGSGGAKGDAKHKGKGAWKGKGKKTEAEDVVEDSDAKMIAAVLSGVNRALPFAQIEDAIFEKHMDTLFRITHNGTFNISIQALNLIHQVTSAKETVSERFYRTLYESLLDPRLATSSKQAMYLNLLFKAIRTDTSGARRAAFVKRTMQVLGTHQPPFICGAFYLLGELFSTTPGLRNMLSQPEEDDELEHFVDAPDPDDEEDTVEDKAVEPKVVAQAVPPAEKVWDTTYDGRKRDPQYAHAEGSCLWEIVPFLSHFHPSVSLHASQLLNNEPITTSSDLNLNTLIHFLDRFVYRNAKKQKAKGASIMQPAAASDKSGVVLMMKGGTGIDAEVNSKEFWRKKEEDVPVDQLFFHKFFAQKLSKEKAKANKAAKRKGGNDSDADDAADMAGGSDDEDLPRESGTGNAKAAPVDLEENDELAPPAEDEDSSDDEAEKEVWKAMQKSMPELEDDGELMVGDSNGEDQSDEEEDVEDDLSSVGSSEIGSLDLGSDGDDDDDSGSDGQIDDADFDSADEEAFDMDEEAHCLTANHQVSTSLGFEDIAAVKEGDLVYALDRPTGRQVLRKVTAVTSDSVLKSQLYQFNTKYLRGVFTLEHKHIVDHYGTPNVFIETTTKKLIGPPALNGLTPRDFGKDGSMKKMHWATNAHHEARVPHTVRNDDADFDFGGEWSFLRPSLPRSAWDKTLPGWREKNLDWWAFVGGMEADGGIDMAGHLGLSGNRLYFDQMKHPKNKPDEISPTWTFFNDLFERLGKLEDFPKINEHPYIGNASGCTMSRWSFSNKGLFMFFKPLFCGPPLHNPHDNKQVRDYNQRKEWESFPREAEKPLSKAQKAVAIRLFHAKAWNRPNDVGYEYQSQQKDPKVDPDTESANVDTFEPADLPDLVEPEPKPKPKGKGKGKTKRTAEADDGHWKKTMREPLSDESDHSSDDDSEVEEVADDDVEPRDEEEEAIYQEILEQFDRIYGVDGGAQRDLRELNDFARRRLGDDDYVGDRWLRFWWWYARRWIGPWVLLLSAEQALHFLLGMAAGDGQHDLALAAWEKRFTPKEMMGFTIHTGSIAMVNDLASAAQRANCRFNVGIGPKKGSKFKIGGRLVPRNHNVWKCSFSSLDIETRGPNGNTLGDQTRSHLQRPKLAFPKAPAGETVDVHCLTVEGGNFLARLKNDWTHGPHPKLMEMQPWVTGNSNDDGFASDDDDLIEVDEDAPYVSSFAPEPEELDESAAAAPVVGEDGKRKRNNAEDRRERKKKRKQFAGAFGTYEDFQKLIEDGGPDDNI